MTGEARCPQLCAGGTGAGVPVHTQFMLICKTGILVIHGEDYIPAARTGLLTFWVLAISANPLLWFLDPIGFRNFAELQGLQVPWVPLELRAPWDPEGHRMPTSHGT